MSGPIFNGSCNQKRFSVFNTVGLIIYLFFLIKIIIFGGSGLGATYNNNIISIQDLRYMDIMVIVINVILFMELYYFEENELFHHDLMNTSKHKRRIDFLLRGFIFCLMVEWIVPIFFFKNTINSHIFHIFIISLLILAWSYLINRRRTQNWSIFTGENLKICDSFIRYTFPFWLCLLFSILLGFGLFVANHPEIINNTSDILTFLTYNNVSVEKDEILLIVNRSSFAIMCAILFSIFILRWREWHLTLFEGRSW